MKTRILATILSLCAAVLFTACVGAESSSSNNGNNTQPTLKMYELEVNDTTWKIYSEKITLTDNAKKNPEDYEYDYTLTIKAADASNQINADSKIFNFYFDADNLEELKNENMTDCENFHLLYRGKMETKASKYNPTGGVMTITEIDTKSISIAFNELTLKAESSNLLLPGQEPATLKISGSIKCSL